MIFVKMFLLQFLKVSLFHWFRVNSCPSHSYGRHLGKDGKGLPIVARFRRGSIRVVIHPVISNFKVLKTVEKISLNKLLF